MPVLKGWIFLKWDAPRGYHFLALSLSIGVPRRMEAPVINTLWGSESLPLWTWACHCGLAAFTFRQGLREQCLWSWWCPLCSLPLWTSLYSIYRQILFGLWSFSHAQYVWSLRPQKSLLSTCHKNFLPRVYIWKIPGFISCVSPLPPWALSSTEYSIPITRVISELHRNSMTHYFHPIRIYSFPLPFSIASIFFTWHIKMSSSTFWILNF